MHLPLREHILLKFPLPLRYLTEFSVQKIPAVNGNSSGFIHRFYYYVILYHVRFYDTIYKKGASVYVSPVLQPGKDFIYEIFSL